MLWMCRTAHTPYSFSLLRDTPCPAGRQERQDACKVPFWELSLRPAVNLNGGTSNSNGSQLGGSVFRNGAPRSAHVKELLVLRKDRW